MKLIYGTGYSLSRAFFDLFYCGEVAGTQWIPRSGPFIVAANHASFFDPPAIGCRLPRQIHYFARKTLFKPGLPAKILHAVNTIPVDLETDSDITALKTVFRVLKEGGGILLFPEGTRTETGELQEPRSGVGMIAGKSKVPVVPARLFGTYDAFGRNRRYPRLNIPVDVAFAPPLYFEDYNVEGKGKERYQAVSEKIMAAIRQIQPPPDCHV